MAATFSIVDYFDQLSINRKSFYILSQKLQMTT